MVTMLVVNDVDLTRYIDEGGLEYSRNDLDNDTTRTLDGLMHRNRVAIKDKLTVKCRPLSQADVRILYKAIEPQTVKVKFWSPRAGLVTKTMYSNNVPATVMQVDEDGNPTWEGIEFPLIEV